MHASARIVTRVASLLLLLPFGAQCFVCTGEALAELGLDPDDPDWAAVGYDLVRPADTAAGARLHHKRARAIAAGIGPPTQRPGRS